MADTGEELGVDLYALLKAGQAELPALADQYRSADFRLGLTQPGLTSAFSRDLSFGGGIYGPAYQPWRDLCDLTADLLNRMASNLDATGDALMTAARAYAETDQAAARKLAELVQDQGEPQLPANIRSATDAASGGSST